MVILFESRDHRHINVPLSLAPSRRRVTRRITTVTLYSLYLNSL